MSILSNIKVSVQSEDFSIEDELSTITNGITGGIVSFTGKVRDLDGNSLLSMTLEHYPDMTEKSLTEIAHRASSMWDVHDIIIVHRIGELFVGDNIVLVVVGSKHRKNAFRACEFIMDYLKTDAPFWKKEKTSTSSNWVSSNPSDLSELNKWKN